MSAAKQPKRRGAAHRSLLQGRRVHFEEAAGAGLLEVVHDIPGLPGLLAYVEAGAPREQGQGYRRAQCA